MRALSVTRYFSAVTFVLLISIPIIGLVMAETDLGDSALFVPIWFLIVFILAVPVHFVADFLIMRSMLQRLRRDRRDAVVLPARIGFGGVIRLAPDRWAPGMGPIDRGRFNGRLVRAVERLVIVADGHDLELWTGTALSTSQVGVMKPEQVEVDVRGSVVLLVDDHRIPLDLVDERSTLLGRLGPEASALALARLVSNLPGAAHEPPVGTNS